MLDYAALPEGFLYFKIGLAGGGALERGDEDADGAARLMHGPFHGVIVLPYVEYLGLGSGLEVFAGKSVIGLCGTGDAGEQYSGDDGGKMALHGFCVLIRNGGAKWTYSISFSASAA